MSQEEETTSQRHPVIIIPVINIYFAMINLSLWPLHILAIFKQVMCFGQRSFLFQLIRRIIPCECISSIFILEHHFRLLLRGIKTLCSSFTGFETSLVRSYGTSKTVVAAAS